MENASFELGTLEHFFVDPELNATEKRIELLNST